ncbi:MAG: sterol desaturase family protein [Proteobacteria bacterium]|nr:sterol desaturase family protein [Pseudomonadota bacterium]
MELNLSFQQLRDLFAASANPAARTILPVILLLVFMEILAIYLRGGRYPWRDTAVSAGVAVGHAIAQALVHGLVVGIFAATVYHYRLFTIDVGLDHWPALVALFLLADFAFYWEHRFGHEIRLMWASHSVHHTIERLVLPAAMRLAWTPIISGVFLFYLPIVWLGFSPVAVFGMASASLTYQIFVHTEIVPRIGWLEWLINTPSAHRVHHASNPEYIDKNYGGVLLIWDHLFGTYKAEQPDIDIKFGLVHARSRPSNVVVIAYEELAQIVRDVVHAKSWRERWGRVFGPPGWSP